MVYLDHWECTDISIISVKWCKHLTELLESDDDLDSHNYNEIISFNVPEHDNENEHNEWYENNISLFLKENNIKITEEYEKDYWMGRDWFGYC